MYTVVRGIVQCTCTLLYVVLYSVLVHCCTWYCTVYMYTVVRGIVQCTCTLLYVVLYSVLTHSAVPVLMHQWPLKLFSDPWNNKTRKTISTNFFDSITNHKSNKQSLTLENMNLQSSCVHVGTTMHIKRNQEYLKSMS